MKRSKIYSALIFLSAMVIAGGLSYTLTFRYFSIEPDVANSPLVWRAFLTEGFSAFKDWAPTPDNWYFTTFPINFIFFALLSDDGKLPLILSTALFTAMTAIIIAAVLNSCKKSKISFLAIVCLTLLPAYSYTFGFLAHAFSHNSTHFFGVVIFALIFWNIKKNSRVLAIIYSLLALLTSISDPWFLASYFLPLLLTQMVFSWKKRAQENNTCYIWAGIYFINDPYRAEIAWATNTAL
ncbi:hypothetical protein ABK905_07435 [Acerihabitans sp. KWT182]|uniref:Glycosyltransferase RgtA/B/C/D-like domain-containing protein n=1 Tax=Acerihabitans sp. KWT182 TaxID=3157919 RepID=A0AAU7QD91_9GAMM